MTPIDDLDRQLMAWLDDPYTPPAPRYLGDVLERTRRTRQRPSWASLERWIPMTVISRPPAALPLRLAWLLIVGALVVALVASAAIVGSRLLTSTGPDGRSAAVFPIPEGNDAILAYATFADAPDGGRIFTARADGEDVRKLTDGPGIATDPIWSPDGTRIAYHLWRDGADHLVVMDAGGGDPITLATNPASDRYCLGGEPVAWSPDGTSLLFPTRDGGCSGGYDLNVVAADGSSPATRLLAPGMHSVFGSWSPDGTQIAYVGSEGSDPSGLYVADVGPEGALAGGLVGERIGPDLGPNLTDLDADPAQGAVHEPRWSPDGTELAMVASTTGFFIGEDERIYIVEADGSGEQLLTEQAGNPQWSPDGQRLAFQRVVDPSERWNDRPCTVRTWIVDADGTNERELADIEDGCDYPAVWSPDGTRLAVNLLTPVPFDATTSWRLGVVSVDGTEPPILVGGDATGVSWQPVAAPLPPAPSFPSGSPTH
jgi:Tol biopolymer transport system component